MLREMWFVSRRTLLALALLLAALSVIGIGVVHVVRQDRAALQSSFATERLSWLKQAAMETANELDDIGDALAFAGHLLKSTPSRVEQERQLVAVLAAVKQYQRIVVYDARGELLVAANDPLTEGQSQWDRFDPALRDAAMLALRQPAGTTLASSPVDVPGPGKLHAFSTHLTSDVARADRAIAVLVDTTPFFRKLSLSASAGGFHLLVAGADGVLCSPTNRTLAARLQPEPGAPAIPIGLTSLGESLRKGQDATLQIDSAGARMLGLPAFELIASVASIRPAGASAWTVATLSSMEPLRRQQFDLLLRFGVGSAAVALCLIGFGAYIVLEARRTIAVEERLKHADQLAHAHDKMEKVLDHVPAGVMVLSQDDYVTSINRFMRERVPEKAFGRLFEVALGAASPQALARLQGLLKTAKTTRTTCSAFGEHFQLFGREGQYTVHVVPLEPRFADASHLVVIEDLSEVALLTTQLLRAEKLATVGVLAAGIAHEIGTPLGVIRARAELIASKLGPDHPQAVGARIINEQIDWVTRTIRHLLDFSRPKVTSGRATELAPVVANVMELLRFEFDRKHLLVESDVPMTLPSISADADQLQQVLVNLLMNASDACPDKGRILVRATAVADRVRVEVEDDGCGIAEDLRHRVFDPFFTTKKRGKGTGLGLTIAAQIVKNHGGEIDILSQAGPGTRIVVAWPTHTKPVLSENEHEPAVAHSHRG